MLIEGATVVTVDRSNRILEPGWIAVRDGRITAVSDHPIAALDGEERLRADGRVIVPGLVNAHTHLFQTLIRGIFDRLPFSRWLRGIYHCHGALSTGASRAAGALGALESLRSGVTTIADHQFLNHGNDWALATIDGIREVGLRTVMARTIMDLGSLAPAAALERPEDGLRSVLELVEASRDATSDRMLTIMTGANTPGVSASGELVLAVRRFAERHGIGRSQHIAESVDVLAAVEADHGKLGVVEWLESIDALGQGSLAAHAVHVSAAEIEVMAARRISVSHNPVSNMFLGDGIAPVPEMLRAGVNVALGTDGASSNNVQDMFEVMKAAALLQRLRGGAGAVDPAVVLRMATINGARALGLAEVTGSIERGKRADLLVLDLDRHPPTTGVHDLHSAIVYCAGPANVDTVLVDGRVLLREGEVVSADERRVLADGRAAAVELGARLRAQGVTAGGTAPPAAAVAR